MDDMASVGLQVDSRPVRTASDDLDKFARSGDGASRSATGATSTIGSMARGAASAAVAMAAAAVSVAAIGAAMVTTISNQLAFGSALAETSTLLNGNAAEMAIVTQASKDLTATYGGTATAQAQGFYQAISAGAGSAAQATELLDTANQLAIGGITSVTTAVDILTTATNIYASEGLLAADASDALFVAMKAGKTTIGELASSLGKVLPLSQNLGVTFDETAATIAALTKSGIATTEAVTGMRAAMTAVLGPSKQASDLAKELGIDFNAAGLQAVGFSEFMADVTRKTGGSSEAMQTLFGSVEATTVALSLSGAAGRFLADILGDMGTKAGATATAFGLMADDDAQRLRVAMGQLHVLMLNLGSAALTILVPAVESVAGIAKLAADNIDYVVVAIAGLVGTAIPGAVAGLLAMTGGMSAAAIATGVFTGAVNIARLAVIALGGPLGVVWGILGAAAAAFVVFRNNGNTASTAMDGSALAASELGIELGLLATSDLPATSAATVALANDNLSLASSAFEAARAQLELAKANAQAAFTQSSVEDAFLPGMVNPGQARLEAAHRSAIEAANALNEAEAELNRRVGKGNAVKIEASKIVKQLAVEVSDLEQHVAGTGVASGKAAGNIEELAIEMTEAEKAVKAYADAIEGMVVSGIGRAVDWMVDGFKGGFKGLLNIAKDTLKQIIAFYLKNRVMLSLGIGGGGVGGATQALAGAAGGGGPLGMLGSLGSGGGMLGGIGGVLGTIGSNFGAGFMTSVYGGLGGLTGAVSGGLSVGGLAGISTAIGAIAAPLLAVILVVSFFKKKTKELDAGLKLTVDGMGTLVQTFKTIETKRFWGLSKKVRTSFQNASDEIANPLIKAVGEIQGGIVDAAALLGIAGSTFDNFAHTINVSTKGMSDADAQKAVTDAFVGLGDAFAGMIPGLQALQKDGEGAMVAISRLAQSLTVVNDVFQSLGFSAYGVSLAGAAAADTFASLFGSLDNFAASTAAYYDAFYTGEEKRADATSRLAASLAALGVSAIPQDRAAFRGLVDSAQLAGNIDLAAGLIMLSPAFAGLTQAVDDLAGLTQAVSQSYYQNFFTDAERIARATELLSIEMLALGIDTLPATRAAFRALVDEADALGDSGLVASLMQLSPAFAEISAGADALGDSLRSLVNEDLFATGQDYVRGLSRSSNSQLFTPQQSDAELRAELRALNVSMERLVSTSEITAGNTGRGADAADDTLAFQLEQTL